MYVEYRLIDNNECNLVFISDNTEEKIESFENFVYLLYDENEQFDTLIKHGSKENTEIIFKEMAKNFNGVKFFNPILLEIPINEENLILLNNCINISASKWCTKLKEKIINDYTIIKNV